MLSFSEIGTPHKQPAFAGAQPGCFRSFSCPDRVVRVQRQERAQLRIDPFDALEYLPRYLDRREVATPVPIEQFRGGEPPVATIAHDAPSCSLSSPVCFHIGTPAQSGSRSSRSMTSSMSTGPVISSISGRRSSRSSAASMRSASAYPEDFASPNPVELPDGGQRLVAGALVQTVGKDEVVEVRGRLPCVGDERAQLHQQAAVAVQHDNFLVGARHRKPQTDGRRAPHALRGVDVEYLALPRLMPRVYRLHRHDRDGVAAPLRDYLYGLVAFHDYRVGAPTMSAEGPSVSCARS